MDLEAKMKYKIMFCGYTSENGKLKLMEDGEFKQIGVMEIDECNLHILKFAANCLSEQSPDEIIEFEEME